MENSMENNNKTKESIDRKMELLDKAHKLVHLTTIVTYILAVSLVFILLVTKKSDIIDLSKLLIVMSSGICIVISWSLVKYFKAEWTKYVAILFLGLIVLIFNVLLFENQEIYITWGIMLVVSIFYMSNGPIIMASLFIILMEIILSSVYAGVVPVVSVSTIGLRIVMITQMTGICLLGAYLMRESIGESIVREIESAKLSEKLSKVIDTINTESMELNEATKYIIKDIKNTKESSEEITVATKEISEITSVQSKDTNNASIVMEQMSSAINNIATSMELVNELSLSFRNTIEMGLESIEYQKELSKESLEITKLAVDTVIELDSHSSEIANIVDIINNIAKQTNLLSLNAAIEAARAGEYGRGFSVVSDEIRKLAEESRESTNKIAKLIGEIQSQTSNTVEVINNISKVVENQEEAVEKEEEMFNGINNGRLKLEDAIQEVSASVEQLLASTEEVVYAVKNTSENSKEIASSTEEVANSSILQLELLKGVESRVTELVNMAIKLNSLADIR